MIPRAEHLRGRPFSVEDIPWMIATLKKRGKLHEQIDRAHRDGLALEERIEQRFNPIESKLWVEKIDASHVVVFGLCPEGGMPAKRAETPEPQSAATGA